MSILEQAARQDAALRRLDDAATADRAAVEAARAARRELRLAALAAADAGVPVVDVAQHAGVRRARIYQWKDEVTRNTHS